MADESPGTNFRPRRVRASGHLRHLQACAKREVRKKLKEVSEILKKKESDRSEEEVNVLNEQPDLVETAKKNAERQLQQRKRVLEIQDPPGELDEKCKELAQLLQSSKNAVVYTGAGISTAASIPDYRGPNGVWTLLKKGQALRPHDLVDAEPTFTHMCLTKLYKEGLIKYLVSQNCDGLHLRSGFPRHSLSEVHGNMFVEICKTCKPQKEFIRLFDVTERTAKGRHKTGRTCNKCGGSLNDSIVHFGEKGGLKSPYRWREASKAASKSDLIVCLGSSLKVLRCYPCLWRMDKRPQQRPKLVIVNLQWTPKDEVACLKINGRCDEVMRKVAHYLELTVPHYRRTVDPLFRLQAPVKKDEETVTSKKILESLECKSNPKTLSKRKCVLQTPKISRRQLSERSCTFKNHHKITLPSTDFSSNNIPPGLPLKQDVFHVKLKEDFTIKDENVTTEQKLTSLPNRETLKIPDLLRAKLEKMLLERRVQDAEDSHASFEEDSHQRSAWTQQEVFLTCREQNCTGIQATKSSIPHGDQGYARTHPVLSLQLIGKSYAGSQSQVNSCPEMKPCLSIQRLVNSFNPSLLPSFKTHCDAVNSPINRLLFSNIKQENISGTSFSGLLNNKPLSCTAIMATSKGRPVTHVCSSTSAALLCDYAKVVNNIANDHTYAKSFHKCPLPFGFHATETSMFAESMGNMSAIRSTRPIDHQTELVKKELPSYNNLLLGLIYQSCSVNELASDRNIKGLSYERLLQNDDKHVMLSKMNDTVSADVSNQWQHNGMLNHDQDFLNHTKNMPFTSSSEVENMQQMESHISITVSNSPPPPVVRIDLDNPAKSTALLNNSVLDGAGFLESTGDGWLSFEQSHSKQELTVARLNDCVLDSPCENFSPACMSGESLSMASATPELDNIVVSFLLDERSLNDAEIKQKGDTLEMHQLTATPDPMQETSITCGTNAKAQKRRCSSASVPGWYGKGLKVRRKRTL